jgi:hypothetical protein
MLTLSQSHLTLLDTCDRKYQYVFIEGLSGPSTHEQKATTQWGSQFHLLMQQRALDLPVEVLAGADAELSDRLAALAKAAPDVFEHLPVSAAIPKDFLPENTDATADAQPFSQSEHRRTLAFNGYLLTVIYDLLVQWPPRGSAQPAQGQISGQILGQIFDWKTHQRPPQRRRLEQDWQTRLYLYVLCETTAIAPENLSMTYWFVRAGQETAEAQEPSAYRFAYSHRQHEQTRTDLQRLTDNLTRLMEPLQRSPDQPVAFPKVAIEKGICENCPFNIRCDRATPDNRQLANLKADKNPANFLDPHQLLRAASALSADSVEEISL